MKFLAMRLQKTRPTFFLPAFCFVVAATAQWQNGGGKKTEPLIVHRVQVVDATAAKIVAGAKQEIGALYNASYQEIAYPNGDISITRDGRKQGACSDVVIRALRFANFDLQRLMHDDMTKNFALYPNLWDMKAPNSSIDHRRVPNQMTFFRRFGQALPTDFTSSTRSSWKPGDIVCWDTGKGRTHTGVLSDGMNQNDVPLAIHNDSVCHEDNCLQRWKIIGHFRFPR